MMRRTTAASLDDEDVKSLKRELEQIGYKLRVRQRVDHNAVSASRRKLDASEGIKKKLDFGEYAKKVRSWDDKKLHYALVDISKTLPASDSMDRANGDSSEGGYYRDEASVIRQEIERRRKGGKREVAEEREYTEAEFIDEAKKRKMKGVWRTTKGGHRIFIENGKITKGNPHLMRAAR
jgi:hypothetical protein